MLQIFSGISPGCFHRAHLEIPIGGYLAVSISFSWKKSDVPPGTPFVVLLGVPSEILDKVCQGIPSESWKMFQSSGNPFRSPFRKISDNYFQRCSRSFFLSSFGNSFRSFYGLHSGVLTDIPFVFFLTFLSWNSLQNHFWWFFPILPNGNSSRSSYEKSFQHSKDP